MLDFNNLFGMQSQSNPLTMMILTRLVSAVATFAAFTKQSPLICVAALDQFGVTTDRATNMPAVMLDMLNVVLKTALRPRPPLSKNRKAYEFYDQYRVDERFTALLGPILGLLETVFVTLHTANDHNKMWHNIPPTIYRHCPLLEALLKVYTALAYKAEVTRDYEHMEAIQSIVMYWFWVPHKERAAAPAAGSDPTTRAHSFHLPFAGPDISRTLNDNHDIIMKQIKEAPRNHYALLFLLCRIVADVEKSAAARLRQKAPSDASSGSASPRADGLSDGSGDSDKDKAGKGRMNGGRAGEGASAYTASASSLTAPSLSSAEPKGDKRRRSKDRARRTRKRAKHGHDDPGSSSESSHDSEWSLSADSDAPPGPRRATALQYARTEEQLYHNIGNVIVDAIGYSLNTGPTELTATYIVRMAQCTAPDKELDAATPERAKLHQAIRQELAAHKKSDYGRKLLQLVDARAWKIPEGYFPRIMAEDPGPGSYDQRAEELRELLHPSILDDFLVEMTAFEEQGIVPEAPKPQQPREGDEDPNQLRGKSWEKVGSRPWGSARSGFDHFRDSFRDRKPNTSRPPSAHVDDFGTVPLTMAQNNLDDAAAVTGFASLEAKAKTREREAAPPRDDTALPPSSPTEPATFPGRDGAPGPAAGKPGLSIPAPSAIDPYAVSSPLSPRDDFGGRRPSPDAGGPPRAGTPPLQFGGMPGVDDRRREDFGGRPGGAWEDARGPMVPGPGGRGPDRGAGDPRGEKGGDRWGRQPRGDSTWWPQ